MSVAVTELSGQRFARVVHTQNVSLGSLDKRLRGVTVAAPVPVLVGESGGRAAVMGAMPELVSTEREAEAFVESLLKNGQIELGSRRAAADGAKRAVARSGATAESVSRQPLPSETHRIVSVGKKKALVRVRFHCHGGR